MREIQGEVSSLISSSSVGKYLRFMAGKGLVQEEKLPYAWRYQALCSEDQVQQQLVSALTDKAFGGSRTKLVLQAFATGATSPEEITALKRLLEQDERKKT
jgi:BlaI family penicillinase repressor